MKKILFLLLYLYTFNGVFSQVKPNEFTEDPTIEDTDAYYTQEGGVSRKQYIGVLRKYIKKDLTANVTSNISLNPIVKVCYINATSGNVTVTIVAPSANPDWTYTFKRTDNTSNVVKIMAASGTIRGSAQAFLAGQWSELSITSNSTSYQ